MDMDKLKIRKKEYHFEVKRRFQNVDHFKVRKKQPIDKIRDSIKALFAPKPKEEPKAKPISAGAPPPGGFNFKILGAALLVAILIIGLGWMYISSTLEQLQPQTFTPQVEKPWVSNLITGGDILTAGPRNVGEHTAMIVTELSTSNIESYDVNLTTYDGVVPSQIFILNSQRVEATTYPQFLTELRSMLSKKQIVLNEITLDQLETLPGGALVIVPSGNIPQELLGIESTTDFIDLVDRGVVFLYIGQPFTDMQTGAGLDSTPEEVLEELGFTFNTAVNLQPTGGLHLFQPIYQVSATSRGWSSSMLYGSVSVAKRGDGAFIFIPQTLDGGWRKTPGDAAEDVSKFIFEYPWLSPNSQVKQYTFNVTSGTDTIKLFTNPFEETACSVKAEFFGHSPTSKFPIEETLVIYLEKDIAGELFIDDGYTLVPTNITGTPSRMNARLQEPEPAQPSMFIEITDDHGAQIQRIPQGTINVQADLVNFDVPIYADQGEYVVSLVDDDGRVYAESYLKVVSIEISRFYPPSRTNSQYAFEFTMDGQETFVEEVTVVVADGQFGTYEFEDVSEVIIDVGPYTSGDQLPFGEHTFEFSAGGLQKTITITRALQKSIFTDPLFWIMAILAGGIIGVGIYFAKQDIVYYSLDIPDFPPIARTKVGLNSDVVLSIFNRVNDNYRWKNAPLTVAEVRNGFKQIFHRGKPVYITDFNVEYLLDELTKKGKVGTFLDYYCPISWEASSKKSVRYLAMMRKLRDICVNNAIPFTGLGKSKLADSEIKVVGQEMYLQFYDPDGDMENMIAKVLSTVGKGITIILFKNNTEKQEFRSLLNSPYKAPLVLKMEAQGSSVLLDTIPEFENMLAELKAV